jgi:hypothetical protein
MCIVAGLHYGKRAVIAITVFPDNVGAWWPWVRMRAQTSLSSADCRETLSALVLLFWMLQSSATGAAHCCKSCIIVG